jgi:hypothetical protein
MPAAMQKGPMQKLASKLAGWLARQHTSQLA